MIRRLATQAVYVSNQQAAEHFWVDKIGFELRDKKDMGNGFFWLEVAPRGGESAIVLYPRELMRDWETKRPSLVFECEGLERFYEKLKASGVRVGAPPHKMHWGSFTTFQDPDGNEFLLKG